MMMNISMKMRACIMHAAFLCTALAPRAYAQESVKPSLVPVAEVRKSADRATSVNVDMQIGYGQYNNVLSGVSLSNEQEDAVYLVSASLKRSDDFGYNNTVYRNSSYSEDRIGYTGNFNMSESWRALVDADVYNDSRGMINNSVFSREEKNEAKISFKNVYKLSNQFEGFFSVGGGEYTHRLRPMDPSDRVEGRVAFSSGSVGGEYIWSASNRIRGKSEVGYYNYRGDAPDDAYSSTEIVDDFNLTKNVGLSLGLAADFNRDSSPLVFPNLVMTLKGFEHASFSISYRYDLIPFQPEVFYLEQKYILPELALPPSRVHHGEVKCELRFNDSVSIKASGVGERGDHFYNYRTAPGDVLETFTMPVTHFMGKLDLGFVLFDRLLEMLLGYEYNRYLASEHVTYRPMHKISGSIAYTGKLWRFEWGNKLMSVVYTDPETKERLNGTVIGTLALQRKMMDSFFAFMRAENIYNYRYNLREGYPEPGITVLFGTRILI